ncbi:unnamed protein product [Linum trigynum]|uniref:Uncharacterized protein n=1 Tax=Linum trigynum TaxID=586398 RepID=A0AAV2DL60_9ROSI
MRDLLGRIFNYESKCKSTFIPHVQVLYFEQVRLRNALCCSYGGGGDHEPDHVRPTQQSWRANSGAFSAAMSPRDNYASLRRENRELKLELARMRMRLNDLEKDHVCMKRDMHRSGSRKFMNSFSKKLGKLGFFGNGFAFQAVSEDGF